MPPASGDARLPQAPPHLLLSEGVGEASAASPPGSVASDTVASGPPHRAARLPQLGLLGQRLRAFAAPAAPASRCRASSHVLRTRCSEPGTQKQGRSAFLVPDSRGGLARAAFFCIVFVPRFLGISGRAWACGRRVIPMIVYPLSNERATGDSKESQGKSGFPLPHTRS